MITRSGRVRLRESPVPVLLVLVGLLGFVEYLHWTVVRAERRPRVIEVPASPPLADDAEQEEDVLLVHAAAAEFPVDGVAGPLHAEARGFAAGGRAADALARLEASLAREGKRDSARLHERGVLLLGLRRDRDALAALEEAQRLLTAAHRASGGKDSVPGSARLLYNLGLARERTGDVSGAEAAYRSAVTANPHADAAWNNLGLLLARRGDNAGATAAFRHAVESAGTLTRPRALTNLAQVLAWDGGADEAATLLVEAIERAPSSIAPRLALAELEGARDAARARVILEEAIRLAPSHPVTYQRLGLLEAKGGDAAAAERNFQRALELRPSYRAARMELGRLLLDANRPAEAARHFEVLLEQREDARAAFGLARARKALRDRAGAEAMYRTALRLAGGDYPEAHYNLGLLLAEGGRLLEAEAYYRAAVGRKPSYAAGWINLALLLEETGRGSEALEAVERALSADATNEKAWFIKGRALAQSGRRAEALQAYLEAVRLRPDYGKALFSAAILHADAGRDEEAIALYQRALAIDSRNASGWFNLGLALHRRARDAEARSAYENALRADPESTGAAKNLGVIYAREGRFEEARRVFADALERRPDDVGLRYNIALQLERRGDVAGALVELRRVVTLDPQYRRGWRTLARLAQASGDPAQAEIARAKVAELSRHKSMPETEEEE